MSDHSLIRYLVTPVWSNKNGTGNAIGALVAGDIVNGKVGVFGVIYMATLPPPPSWRSIMPSP